MKKLTVAVLAAAALSVGAAATASAGTEISGWVDARFHAVDTATVGGIKQANEGQFGVLGELDVVHEMDGATVRMDLDVANRGGVNGMGADLVNDTSISVEQLYGAMPLGDIATLSVGTWNTIIGYEGQDSTDVSFVTNSLVWAAQPTNHTGALVTMSAMDMLTVNLGYANSLNSVSKQNSFMASVTADLMDGLAANVGYIQSDGTTTAADSLLDFWVGYDTDMMGAFVEYMIADSNGGAINANGGTAAGVFDHGVSLGAHGGAAGFDLAVRYDATQNADGATDPTQLSVSLTHACDENQHIRFDYTSSDADDGATNNNDALVVQYLRTF